MSTAAELLSLSSSFNNNNTNHGPSSYFLSSLVSFATGVLFSWWYLQTTRGGSAAARRQLGKAAVTMKTSAAVAFRQQEEMQLALIVRKDLKMGTGKVAAQCAHAAVAVVEEVQAALRSGAATTSTTSTSGTSCSSHEEDDTPQKWLGVWLHSGSAKVALQVDSEDALLSIAKEAKAHALPYYVVRDAGRTQIAAGSKTVVAIGPAPKSRVQLITGKLKLL